MKFHLLRAEMIFISTQLLMAKKKKKKFQFYYVQALDDICGKVFIFYRTEIITKNLSVLFSSGHDNMVTA